tara:strand:- start:7623 stop:7988 length:366 start_codon:yes stop_codon:yes gene_type:complete
MAHPSKVKGNAFEREVVRLFESYGIECKRAWGSNGQALGLHEEVDCLAEGDLRIQAKRRKKIAEWLKPSVFVDSVVVREDRGKSYIIIRLEEFAEEYAKYLKLRELVGKDTLKVIDGEKDG